MKNFKAFFSSIFSFLGKNDVVLQKNGAAMTEKDIEQMADTFSNSATLGEALQNAVIEVSGGFNNEINKLKALQSESSQQQENRLKAVEGSVEKFAKMQQLLDDANTQIQQLQRDLKASIQQVAQNNAEVAQKLAKATDAPLAGTQGVQNFHKVVEGDSLKPKGIFDHLKD